MAFTPCCLCSSSVLPSFTCWHVPTWFLLLPWPGLAVLPSGVSGRSSGSVSGSGVQRIWCPSASGALNGCCHLTSIHFTSMPSAAMVVLVQSTFVSLCCQLVACTMTTRAVIARRRVACVAEQGVTRSTVRVNHHLRLASSNEHPNSQRLQGTGHAGKVDRRQEMLIIPRPWQATKNTR